MKKNWALTAVNFGLLLQVDSGSKSTEEASAAASGLFRQPGFNRCTAVLTAPELLIAVTDIL